MPHCIIEYAQSVESVVSADVLMNTVYKGTVKSGLFSASDIKVRAIAYRDYMSGDENAEQCFVHVCLKILSGRTLEQRTALSQSVLQELSELFTESISLTVEVVDMEKVSYAKQIK